MIKFFSEGLNIRSRILFLKKWKPRNKSWESVYKAEICKNELYKITNQASELPLSSY